MNFGPRRAIRSSNSQSGTDPKVGLSYQVNRATMVYASASKGFRAGGAQAYAPFCSLAGSAGHGHHAAEVGHAVELRGGHEGAAAEPGLLFSAAAFHIDWKNIQQQVALPCGYYFDINGDAATINGGEIEIARPPLQGLASALRRGL